MRLPKSILPECYDLELWMDMDSCTFKGKLKTQLKVMEPSRFVILNSAALSINSVLLESGNKLLEATSTTENTEDEILTLEFDKTLAPGDGLLIIEYNGSLSEKVGGFYKSPYQDENGVTKYMAAGVFEPAEARYCLPCWDEPSFKARFKVKVHTASNRTVLSNMPAIQETVVGDLKTVEFQESVPMSTYIFTIVVGELEYMEATSEDGVAIRVYTRPGYLHKGKFVLDITLKALPFFSKLFGSKYPLPKLDLVGVPTFPSGALECFGCVVYLEEALFVEEDASAFIRQRATLDTAHEIEHMWFGNLVTMDWWTHLWLNEGMATWMSYYAVDHIFPEWEIWISFYEIKESGQKLDALVTSHPVEVAVNNSREAESAFDAISYFKGASIIHMLQDYISPAELQAGLAAYVRRFAFGNANSDDLWETFEDTTGKPIKEMMHSWTKQKGYPVIKATLLGNNVVQLEQCQFLASGSEGDGLWIVPIAYKSGGEAGLILLPKDEPVQVQVKPGSWFHVNPGQAGFYCVQYDPKLLGLLEKSFSTVLSPIDRLGLLKDVHSLCQAGKQPLGELVQLLSLYDDEQHPAVLSTVIDVCWSISNIVSVTLPELSDKANMYFARKLERFARSTDWDAKDHSVSLMQGKLFNALVSLGHGDTCLEARKLFTECKVPPSHMKAVYRNAMACIENFDILVQMFRSSANFEERLNILGSIAWSSDSELVQKALDFSMSEEVKPQEVRIVFSGLKPEVSSAALKWLQNNWERVSKKVGSMMVLVVRRLAEKIYNEATAKELEDLVNSQCNRQYETKELQEDIELISLRVRWAKHLELEAPMLFSEV